MDFSNIHKYTYNWSDENRNKEYRIQLTWNKEKKINHNYKYFITELFNNTSIIT